MWQIGLLPLLVFATVFVLAIPIGLYMAWIFEGRYRLPRWLGRLETQINTGVQNWKQYAFSFMAFNILGFAVGFLVRRFSLYLPLNPDGKGMLSPTTIFNTTASFVTNTNLQHYAGEVHLSYFSQLFFVLWHQLLSPMIGMAALLAIIRGLRGDKQMGNFYVDLWRGVVYVYLPLCLVVGILMIATGVPMTLDGHAEATTLDPGAMGTDPGGQPILVQQIARGPVAAILAAKQFGTNGGGFFGTNTAHPFENPNAFSNLVSCIGIFSCRWRRW